MKHGGELVWSAALAAGATAAYVMAGRGELPAAGSMVGHLLGVTGLLLMLFAWTGYSWRKQPGRTGPGSMQSWLRAHVVAGLLGPWLALLHGAFAFRGLAGVLAGLTLVVVGSGALGRYVFSRVPVEASTEATDGGASLRRPLALWWLLHVPLSAAVFTLAAVHVVAALYYATFLR